jgi:hypothetical protein
MAQVANSASDDMGVDDWLNHGDSGGGGQFLKLDFDEVEEYLVWLHPKAPIRALWRHPWMEVSRDGKKVLLTRFTSMEKPIVMREQYFRNDDGSRQQPPQMCPFSLLQEWVHEQIESGKINWCDPIFKVEASEETRVVYAGGWLGMFQSKKLSDKQKEEIRTKTKTQLDKAYLQNGRAKEQTVFIVVDNDAPKEGPRIAAVGDGLSKAFKAEVQKRKKANSKNPELADPIKNPVCFSWTKLDKFNFSVAATDIDRTPEIDAAFEMPPCDTSKMFEPSNVAKLRESVEEFWCHDVTPDFDKLFAEAFKAVKGTPAAELPMSFSHGANADSDGEGEEGADGADEPAAGAPAGAAEPSPCDACGKDIPDEVFDGDPVKCPHCGVEYKLDDADGTFKVVEKPAPPPPPPASAPPVRASRRTAGKKTT